MAMSARTLLPLGVALVAYSTVLARGSALLADPDIYMHIAAGRWIIAHAAVPHADIFSHSMRGIPWVPHEWLSEVMIAYLYDHAGWAGLVVLTALALALAMAILTRALLAYLAPAYALIGATTAWGMCFPHLLARPHVLAYPLLVVWVAALVTARCKDRAPSPYLALLIALWANLHGSFVFGLVLAALFAGEALFEAQDWTAARRAVSGWGLFGLLSVVAAFATPNGISGVLLPFQMNRMDFALSWITEWKSPDFQHSQPIEAWLMLALLGALTLGVRLPITRIVMLLVLLHMALQHLRHGELLGLATPLLVAPALAPQLPRSAAAFAIVLLNRRRGSLMLPAAAGVAAVVGAFVLAAGATALRVGVRHATDRITPSAALAAARQHQVTGPVFNDFNFGGFLIFSGVAPFIDGRADMYGDEFVRRYAKREELPRLLSQYGISWTLLGADHPSVLLLDHMAGWRRLYSDPIAVIHVRGDR
jgi:hypothetical protein